MRMRISENIVFPGARNSKAPKLAKGHHSEKEKGEERAGPGTESFLKGNQRRKMGMAGLMNQTQQY